MSEGGVVASRASAGRALAPLSLLTLGLVAERPMHAYEMVQTILERSEDRLVRFRPGTLYHAVDRLAADELITVFETRREGNRPERTVYAITDRGRSALAENLERTLAHHPTEYPELYLALAEAHALPRVRVRELLATRMVAMTDELDSAIAAADAASDQGKPEMFYLDAGCRIATLRAQLDWLEGLLERLDNHDIEWLDDPDSIYAAMTHLPADASPAPEKAHTT